MRDDNLRHSDVRAVNPRRDVSQTSNVETKPKELLLQEDIYTSTGRAKGRSISSVYVKCPCGSISLV